MIATLTMAFGSHIRDRFLLPGQKGIGVNNLAIRFLERDLKDFSDEVLAETTENLRTQRATLFPGDNLFAIILDEAKKVGKAMKQFHDRDGVEEELARTYREDPILRHRELTAPELLPDDVREILEKYPERQDLLAGVFCVRCTEVHKDGFENCPERQAPPPVPACRWCEEVHEGGPENCQEGS